MMNAELPLPNPYDKQLQPQRNVEMTASGAGTPPWTPSPMVEPPDMYEEAKDSPKCCSCSAPGSSGGISTIITE